MRTLRRPVLMLVATFLVLLGLGLAGHSLAQTDPPALGDGDWTVRDDTVIDDWDVIMLRGDLHVTDEGSLTLSNSTLLFVNADAGEHGILVDNGGTFRILDGATVGSSRPNVPITFVVEAGCTLEIRDSFIEEVGMPAFGLRPDWREISLYIGTPDAVIEDSTFTGGLAGPFFDEGVIAPPVRNCTFENVYGIISYGVGIEDCTFRNQNIFGIVFHGGDSGYVARCTFESVFATCVNVGYEYFEPYELHPAEANVLDCTFEQSTRAIRVLDQSASVITNCTIDGMEREGIVVGVGTDVAIVDCSVNNTYDAVLCAAGGSADLTVTTSAYVRGGALTLSGNITLTEDARFEVSDFRNITMLSTTVAPLTINLAEGSVLALTRGDLEIPAPGASPETWSPVLLGPDTSDVRGALHLEEVEVLDLADGYHIAQLRAVRSTIPLGSISVERLFLEECALVPDMRASMVALTLGSTVEGTDCYLHDCWLEGIERLPSQGPWLIVRTTKVHSYDFLYDLDEMIDKGAILLAGSTAGPAEFDIWWSARTHVRWQNYLPIPAVEVSVASQTGTVYTSTTDARGDTPRTDLLTEALDADGGYTSHLPMTFSVNVSGLERDTSVSVVDRPIEVDLVVIDLVPPRLLLDLPDVLATNSTNLTVSGTILDEHSGVAFLEISLLPSDYIRVPVDLDTGRFEHAVVLRKGYQSIAIRGYDTVGNRNVRVVEVFYSITPPYVFIEEPLEGAWVNSALTFVSGITEEGATVELQGRVTDATNGSFRIPAYLTEGPNLLMVNVTSKAGNHNSTQVTVYLDTIEPTLEIFDPIRSPYETQTPYHRIRGRAEEGAQVFINQVPVEVDQDGTFVTSQVNLDEGSTRVTVYAVDAAGNENSTEVVFVLDSQPPSLFVLVDGEDATRYTGEGRLRTSASTVRLTITTDEDTMLLVDGEEVSAGASEVVLDHVLVEGLQTITVYVEDSAGNGLGFPPINIDVDWTPPGLSLNASMPSSTEETLLSLRGVTEPNCTVTVNGVRVSVDTQGAFVKNFLLNEGTNTVVVLSTDRYGQTSRLVYQVEMVAPGSEPWPDSPSLLPLMLGITIAVIVVEVVALQLYWRRKGVDKGS